MLSFEEFNEERRLDPKCWAGYKKDGTKMKNGIEVNNCVKVSEGSGLDFLSKFVPDAVLNKFKKSVHKKKYLKATDIYRTIIKDKSRSVSVNDAIKKAADIVGISHRDFAKLMQNVPK